MQTRISITENVGVLTVTYGANLIKDEVDIEGKAINGIAEVEAHVVGEGIDMTRYYLSTGQFRPSASAERLTTKENKAILTRVKSLFDEYGKI